MTVEATDPVQSKKLPRFVDALLVVLVAFAIYWPARNAPFVFDDLHIVVENEFVHAGEMGTIWSTGYWDGFDELLGEQQALYRPLTVQSYAWSWAMAGPSPAAFRIANIFLHGLTSVLVLALLRRLLRARGSALAGALLFAAHPIHTEAVTYIAGRADILAGLFFFGGWLAFAELGRARGRARWVLYALSLASYALGLLSKEMAATLPAVLILFDFVEFLGSGDSLGAGLRKLLRRWKLYAGHFAVLGMFLVLRGAVLGALLPQAGLIKTRANPLANLSLVERFDDAWALLGRELALLVFPHPLSVDYSFNAIPTSTAFFSSSATPFAALALGALLLACVLLLRRRALMLAGALLFFFGTLFPVSNLLFIIGTNLGERVLYLVSFGVALAFAAALRFVFKQHAKAPALGLAATLLLTLLAGWRTLVRNTDYASGYTLFDSARHAYPDACRAHFNFGVYASERSDELVAGGRGEEAKLEFARASEAYARALAIDPTYSAARYEVARFAQKRGDFASAADHFQVILEDGAEASGLPGVVAGFVDSCLAANEAQRGRRVLRQSVAGRAALRGPFELGAGLLEAALGNDVAARAHFEALLAQPTTGDEDELAQRVRVLTELARVESRLGNRERSRELFEQAIASSGGSLGPHLFLIADLREQGRLDDAESAIERAQASFPGNYLLGAERGHVARARGDVAGALREYSAALASEPRHQATRQAIAAMGSEALERANGADLPAEKILSNLRDAENALRAALTLNVRRPGLLLDYAQSLVGLGRWKEASALLERIADQGGPLAALASAHAGDCWLALGDLRAARAAYERALKLDAGLEVARLGLARVDLHSDAAGVAQALRASTSRDALVVRLRALLEAGDESALEAALNDFDGRFPGDPGSMEVRARWMSADAAQLPAAIDFAKRALQGARPGTWLHLRALQTLDELYSSAGLDGNARETRIRLQTWAPESPR